MECIYWQFAVTAAPNSIKRPESAFMRLSEKTIELNYCSQFQGRVLTLVHWFGLTQVQEARAGFDIAASLGGRLFLFQFKASDYVLKSGARRFYFQHHQLVALQNRVRAHQRSVFYVLPRIGTTQEFGANPNLMAGSFLLDVARIPPLPPPTKRSGALRRSALHYADVLGNTATIHSDSVEIELVTTEELISAQFRGSDGLPGPRQSFDSFWEYWRFTETMPQHSFCAAISPQGRP